jgi:hypothetical protein
MIILPTSDIVVNPVAVSPPVEHGENSARWLTVVRHVTAAALALTVVGAVAYWQLMVYAGQIQRAANPTQLTPAASSGAGDATQPAQEPPVASNAAIDDTAATEPPAQASPPLAGPAPSTSGPLHPSIEPALTAPVFQAFATDDADQTPTTTAAELSVASSDDPDAVWLDSVSGGQLLRLASALPEPPSQQPAIGQSAAGTEPVEPQAQTAVVTEKPSEVVPALTNTATPAPATDSGLAAAPASRAPGADIQASPGDAADASHAAGDAETAPIVASEASNTSTPTAEHVPPPATNPVAPPPAVPATPEPVPDITASLAMPTAPSVSSPVATPAPVQPQQSAIVSLPPVATPTKVPATSPQVPSAATAPVAPPPTSAASVDSATLHAPIPPKQPPPAAPVASSAPHLDLGLLLSRGNAMLALGDISAARLFYERAAALGSAGAATALGNTSDAAFLASIQAKGIVPDQAAAIAWYRKAAALGDTEAVRQLKRFAPAQ